MKKVILLVIMTVAALSTSHAKSIIEQDMVVEIAISGSKVSGVILDKQTNESLAGVTVSIGDQKVYSDLDGHFTIERGDDKCELKISMISYEEQVVVVDARTTDVLQNSQLSQR